MLINKLSMHCFRGASQPVDLAFDITKPLVMIFGENGTGKSTIIDAIDLLVNEQIGSIADRSSATVAKHGPTIGKKPADVSVEVASGTQQWKGMLTGSRAAVTGPAPRPTVHVLRRSRLRRLIEAEPAERYKALAKFIDVQGVEASENALAAAVATLNSSLTAAIQQKQQSDDGLAELWNAEGKPGSTAIAWGRQKSKQDVSTLQAGVTLLNSVLGHTATAAAQDVQYQTAVTARRSAQQTVDAVKAEIAVLPGLAPEQAVQLIGMLESANAIISTPGQPEKCPVCEQPKDLKQLKSSLDSQLAGMRTLRDIQKRLSTAEATLAGAVQNVNSSSSTLLVSFERLAKVLQATPPSPVAALGIAWSTHATDDAGRKPDTTAAEASAAIAQLAATVAALQADRDAHTKDLNQHNAIRQHCQRIDEADELVRTSDEVLKRLRRLLDIVRDRRLRFTQGVLDAVAAEANRLYGEIHPDENIGLGSLRLDTAKRGSLHQDGHFNGHTDVPPQAYFSDSHLDTLGFCVWLALAKREDPADAILVIDDVFTSVDAPHLTRIIDLLAVECTSFCQVIVTTHYRNWRDRYRVSHGPGNNVQLIELQRWTLLRGISPRTSTLAIDDLATAITATSFDRQIICSRAGILLEAILDGLSLQYRCSIARTRDGDYTLGELMDGCTKLFKTLTIRRPKAGDSSGATEDIAMKPLLNSVGSLAFVRNQVGCHFNLAGSDISDADICRFGDDTVALVRAVTCTECGDMCRRKKGTFFECTCGKTQMTPLMI